MVQKRLLIVDDDRLFHIIGKSFLNRESFSFDTARSGPEALEKARSTQPDLVLLDYEMKDMNGCEVCHELKSDQDTQHIPVIICSSAASDNSRENCLAAGCSAFLLKPVRRDDLISIVEEILNDTQRSLPRASVRLPVIVFINDRVNVAVVRSLSITGALIVMAGPLKPGDQFEVSFTDSELFSDPPLRVEVVWVGIGSEKDEDEVGVRFLEIGYIERELLARYVTKKLKQIETIA